MLFTPLLVSEGLLDTRGVLMHATMYCCLAVINLHDTLLRSIKLHGQKVRKAAFTSICHHMYVYHFTYNCEKLTNVCMCCRQHDLGVPASWLQHQVC